ncbi:MAG: aminotransferase [Geminicoccaceae bacterium]
MSAADIRAWDNQHHLHPWEAMWSFGGADRTVTSGGQGIYLYDDKGRRLIDGPGGMWCVQIGHGRREMAAAIAEQAMRLSYNSPWGFANEPAARLARKLAELSPGDLNTVMFTTGGSTAVDTALRFTQFYNNRLGRPEKKVVISRERSYHGSTHLSASVSGRERFASWFDRESKLVHFLPDVSSNLRPAGMGLEEWATRKAKDLEDAIRHAGADRVAAFIAEPILASGGVVIPAPGYHERCLEICRRHDVLFIADEVVTAFGRLGHWFAAKDVFGIEPDLITCAKGLTSGYLPLGACLISDRLMAEVSGEDHEQILFSNGYTYSGHPVCCAAALENIRIIEEEGLLEHVRAIAPHFAERLHALRRHPIVGDTRGMGLVGCVEGRPQGPGDRFARDLEFGNRVDQACEERGLIVRPLVNMCVFSPPLVITEDEIDAMFDILDTAIEDVSAGLQRLVG